MSGGRVSKSFLLKLLLLVPLYLGALSCQIAPKSGFGTQGGGTLGDGGTTGGTSTGNAVVRLMVRLPQLDGKLELPFIRTAHAEFFTLSVCLEGVRFVGASNTPSTPFLSIGSGVTMMPGFSDISVKDFAVPAGDYSRIEVKVRQVPACFYALRIGNGHGVLDVSEATLSFLPALQVKVRARLAYQAVLDFKTFADHWVDSASPAEVATVAAQEHGNWVSLLGNRYPLTISLEPFGNVNFASLAVCSPTIVLHNQTVAQEIEVPTNTSNMLRWDSLGGSQFGPVSVPLGVYDRITLELRGGCTFDPSTRAIVERVSSMVFVVEDTQMSFIPLTGAITVLDSINFVSLQLVEIADALVDAVSSQEVETALSSNYGRFR